MCTYVIKYRESGKYRGIESMSKDITKVKRYKSKYHCLCLRDITLEHAPLADFVKVTEDSEGRLIEEIHFIEYKQYYIELYWSPTDPWDPNSKFVPEKKMHLNCVDEKDNEVVLKKRTYFSYSEAVKLYTKIKDWHCAIWLRPRIAMGLTKTIIKKGVKDEN